MTTTTSAIEHRTFRGPGGAGAPDLGDLPGVHRVEAAPQRVIETERFDTDDLRLAAAAITLALHRREGEQPYWQLDLPDGERAERLRMPLAPDSGARPAVPGELDQLVRSASRQRAVRPVGQIRSVRTELMLIGAQDRPLVVVGHSAVTIATLGRSTQVLAWSEVDVLPAPGGDELLDAVVRRLAERGMRPAPADADTELQRLLRPTPRRGSAGRPSSAGAVLMDYIARQARRIAAEDLRVRRDEPDSVHQLRVASRRLRSALRAYRRLLDRDRVDPIADGLRELGRRLAPARDAEVLRERVDTELAALPPELRLGPVQAQATRHFARVESEARAAVLTALDGEEYASLRKALDQITERPPLTKRAGRRASKELKGQLKRTSRRLGKAMDVALANGEDAALHEARKATKRLRYAAEVASDRRARRALKPLQKALGEHQDMVVARASLRHLGATAENGFSFGMLHALATVRADAVERELPELWRRTRKRIR